MLPTLQRLAATEGVLDRIRFLCDRTDIPALLGNADIFVLPSRYEGFGLVLLEAMAAGVPVVAADVDGPAELLVDGSNGIKFKACSAEDLADKIAALAANPEVAARIATTAQHFVTEFDIANMREQYFAILSADDADDESGLAVTGDRQAEVRVDDAAIDGDGVADHIVSGPRGEIDRDARHVLRSADTL